MGKKEIVKTFSGKHLFSLNFGRKSMFHVFRKKYSPLIGVHLTTVVLNMYNVTLSHTPAAHYGPMSRGPESDENCSIVGKVYEGNYKSNMDSLPVGLNTDIERAAQKHRKCSKKEILC